MSKNNVVYTGYSVYRYNNLLCVLLHFPIACSKSKAIYYINDFFISFDFIIFQMFLYSKISWCIRHSTYTITLRFLITWVFGYRNCKFYNLISLLRIQRKLSPFYFWSSECLKNVPHHLSTLFLKGSWNKFGGIFKLILK